MLLLGLAGSSWIGTRQKTKQNEEEEEAQGEGEQQRRPQRLSIGNVQRLFAKINRKRSTNPSSNRVQYQK